jgi:hypothetical protein
MKQELKQKLKKDQAYSKLLSIATIAKRMKYLEIEKGSDEAGEPINYFIKKIYGLENQELATFKGWKEKGFTVKKGEKAFIFFSAPKNIKEKFKNIETDQEKEINKTRFCKCYLFSRDQVEPIEK